jgi:hypothetical protein
MQIVLNVIPAQAGIQRDVNWTPALAQRVPAAKRREWRRECDAA